MPPPPLAPFHPAPEPTEPKKDNRLSLSSESLKAIAELTAAMQRNALTTATGGGGPASQSNSITTALATMNSTLSAMYQLSQRSAALAGLIPSSGALPSAASAKGASAQAWAGSHNKLVGSVNTLSQLGMHGIGGTASRIGGFAEGIEGLGARAAGTALNRAAVPLAITHAAIDTAAKVTDLARDPYLTDAQKGREAFRQFVPGGETIQGWADSFSGRNHAMSLARDNSAYAAIAMHGRIAKTHFGLENNPHVAGLSAYAQSFTGQAPGITPVMDRSTAAGETAYRLAMKVLPLRQETLRTERELAKAAAERQQSSSEEFQISRRINALQGQQARIKLNEGSGPDLVRKQEQYRNNAAEIQALAEARRQALTQTADAASREAVARGENFKAKTREELEGRAERSQDLANRSRAGAQSLGAIPWYLRGEAVQAVRVFKNLGPDALPQSHHGFVQSLDPQGYEEGLRKAGENSFGYQQLQKMNVQNFPGGKYADHQREADQARKESGEAEFKFDADTAKRLADIGRSVVPYIEEAMKQVVAAQIQALKGQILAGKTK